MKKIISIVGARPQFIKAAMISRELKNYPVEEIILHTGQHYDDNMSKVFFKDLQIPTPKYNLGINCLSHGAMTGRMLEKIEQVLNIENPDIVIVYGDTNSTLAGTLAAKKLHIPIAHVEAGLRSFNMNMPEEINRIVADRISDYLYCPSQVAVDNLKDEGLNPILTGDVMYDALLYYSELNYKQIFDKEVSPFVLCTIHREENLDIDKLKHIIATLNLISEQIKVICPLHPHTKKIISKNKISTQIEIIEPVGYLEMLKLLHQCSLVITDSGGLQKEAYFFRKHCITLREETEWVELSKVNRLVGSDPIKILNEFYELINEPYPCIESFYGDGNAAYKICDHINGL